MSDKPERINLSDIHSRQVDTNLLNELRDLFAKTESQKERYDFTWNGKANAYFEAAAPTTKTLHVQPKESVNFEKTENLFITGDNLDVLKLLQESYLGKIDMIYIDPPYNTGKDFVYQDNFKKTKKENDISEGNLDEYGNRLVKNDKSNGRYHSDWLTMMYPRLKLSRNLLSNTGAIFVSIDENEMGNIRMLLDEIFGEDNYVGDIVRKTRSSANDSGTGFNQQHEYVLIYGKNISLTQLKGEKKDTSNYKNPDNDPVGSWISDNPSARSGGPNSAFKIINPKNGHIDVPPVGRYWAFSKTTFDHWVKSGKVFFKDNPKNDQRGFIIKKYLSELKSYFNTVNSLFGIDNIYMNQAATKYVRDEIFDGKNYFTSPKPVDFIKKLIQYSSNDENIILDFFAGSGTTADAVMQLNAKDGGNRKFIVVTLDEETPENSEARKAGYATIDQISRERIRRAAEKIGDKSGFRALKVDSTGLKEDVFKTAVELDQVDLLQDIDNHSDNCSEYDLLYDVLIAGALEYNRLVTIDMINDKKVIKYDYLGELSGVVCYFGEDLTDELTRQIATLKPLIAVFKESTFDKSARKVNMMEQFRIISPDTKVKVI